MSINLTKLLTVSRSVDVGDDRPGKFKLRNRGVLPRFGQRARPVQKPPAVRRPATAVQASLFAPPESSGDVVLPTVAPVSETRKPSANSSTFALKTVTPSRPGKGFWRALRDRLRLRSKPRVSGAAAFQAELALDKVTVKRNDLSESDLVVIAVQRKPAANMEGEARGSAVRWSWTNLAARVAGRGHEETPTPITRTVATAGRA